MLLAWSSMHHRQRWMGISGCSDDDWPEWYWDKNVGNNQNIINRKVAMGSDRCRWMVSQIDRFAIALWLWLRLSHTSHTCHTKHNRSRRPYLWISIISHAYNRKIKSATRRGQLLPREFGPSKLRVALGTQCRSIYQPGSTWVQQLVNNYMAYLYATHCIWTTEIYGVMIERTNEQTSESWQCIGNVESTFGHGIEVGTWDMCIMDSEALPQLRRR